MRGRFISQTMAAKKLYTQTAWDVISVMRGVRNRIKGKLSRMAGARCQRFHGW